MIHIYFRTSGKKKATARPEWFSYDKCWYNLLETRMKNPITVIHDGILEDFSKYDSNEDVKVIEINSEELLPKLMKEWEESEETYHDRNADGHVYKKRVEPPDREKAAGWLMYEQIYKNLESSNDLVYIIEDDYLHMGGWPMVLENLYECYPEITYTTLYDHPDKYTQRYANTKTPLILTNFAHWRFVPSTCGTFACRIKDFIEDKDIHMDNLGDHNKFIKLAEKNRSIASPIPGIATHCVEPWITPFRDWTNL